MSNPVLKELSLLQTRLEAWRRHYGGRGRPIPEDLWSAAALVAQDAGVETTARTLRLNRTRLARRLGTAETCEIEDAQPPLTFVELAVEMGQSTADEMVVELMNAHGDQLRIAHVNSETLMRLTETFLRMDP